MSLCSLSKNVCRRMPKDPFSYKASIHHTTKENKATLTFWMFKIQHFELARTLERPFEIPERLVDLTMPCQHRRKKNDVERVTFAITARSERPLETSLATSIGLVSQLVPLRSDPSGIVIVIGSLGCATKPTSAPPT